MQPTRANAGPVSAEQDRQLRAACTRTLSYHRQKSVRETLAALARHPLAAQLPDLYGDGGAVAELERTMRINEDVIRYLTIRVDELEEGPSVIMQNRGSRDDRQRRSDRDRAGDGREAERPPVERAAPETEAMEA